jgi:acetylornithine/N-succinyldiaminopimelate aminotransferase
MARVARLGALLRQRLAEIEDRYPSLIEEIRGEGLMFGVKTRIPNGDFAAAARAEGLLTVLAGDNVVRLLPPLIIDESDIAAAAARLSDACARLAAPAEKLGAA